MVFRHIQGKTKRPTVVASHSVSALLFYLANYVKASMSREHYVKLSAALCVALTAT